jgi:hypothetical protein
MQRTTKAGVSVLLLMLVAVIITCRPKQHRPVTTAFTRIDSLTDVFLSLQDTLLHSWHLLLKNETEKLTNIDLMLDILQQSTDVDQSAVLQLRGRLVQLRQTKLSETTLSQPTLLEEYDFASNALITELQALVEQSPALRGNTQLSTLADLVAEADQRVFLLRQQHDTLVVKFNQFLDKYQSDLSEFAPTFQGHKMTKFSDTE